jgi:uncharacterized membrane protein
LRLVLGQECDWRQRIYGVRGPGAVLVVMLLLMVVVLLVLVIVVVLVVVETHA